MSKRVSYLITKIPNEGKVFLYDFGKKIMDKIMDIISNTISLKNQ